MSWLFASPLLSLQDGVTPLIAASHEGHTSVVKLLLEAKAEIDVQNKVMLAVVACIICSVVVSSIGAVSYKAVCLLQMNHISYKIHVDITKSSELKSVAQKGNFLCCSRCIAHSLKHRVAVCAFSPCIPNSVHQLHSYILTTECIPFHNAHKDLQKTETKVDLTWTSHNTSTSRYQRVGRLSM